MKKAAIFLLLLLHCSPAGPLVREQSFTDNGDGSVTDNITHLLWQKQVDPTKRRWEGAVQYCEDLVLAGKNNWHLPTARELMDLTIPNQADPSINAALFPDTPPGLFWTRSAPEGGGNVPEGSYDYMVAVDFRFGDLESPLYKAEPCYVRCVCRPE